MFNEKNQFKMIIQADVYEVAKSLDITITEKQADSIVDKYPTAQDEDPSGTWDLVIEQLIYEEIE